LPDWITAIGTIFIVLTTYLIHRSQRIGQKSERRRAIETAERLASHAYDSLVALEKHSRHPADFGIVYSQRNFDALDHALANLDPAALGPDAIIPLVALRHRILKYRREDQDRKFILDDLDGARMYRDTLLEILKKEKLRSPLPEDALPWLK